jgi:3-oxoacyl-[acyl-carrier protein] reductase
VGIDLGIVPDATTKSTSKGIPEGKVVAVIGASGGIGYAIAERIAETGAALTLGYNNNQKAARELAEKIKAKGGRASFSQVDISDPESVRDFLSVAEKQWGRVDSIVVATGPTIPICSVMDVSYDVFKSVVNTEVFGSFNIVKEGIVLLRKQPGKNKSILFVLSTALLRTLKHDGLSYIPKMAVMGLIKQTVRDIGGEGIRLNAIGTGAFLSGMGERVDYGDNNVNDLLEDVMTPSKRWGTGREIADVAEFLISDRATYVNGQILGVDGGYSS